MIFLKQKTEILNIRNNKSNTECGIIRPTNAFTQDHIHYMYLEVHVQLYLSIISCKGYNVNLETAAAAISVFVECPTSIASKILVVLRPYQNMKSIRRAVFNLSSSQAISCIGYNVNLQTLVAAILVFIDCPKSIASKVLVVLRPYQKVKSI